MQCAGITKGGGRCKAFATGGAKGSAAYCYSHDPSRAEERRRNAARGGQLGGNGRSGARRETEIAVVKQRLFQLANDTLEGSVDKGVAAVVNQVLGCYLRAISVELAVKEQLEITERLEALEDTDTWGA